MDIKRLRLLYREVLMRRVTIVLILKASKGFARATPVEFKHLARVVSFEAKLLKHVKRLSSGKDPELPAGTRTTERFMVYSVSAHRETTHETEVCRRIRSLRAGRWAGGPTHATTPCHRTRFCAIDDRMEFCCAGVREGRHRAHPPHVHPVRPVWQGSCIVRMSRSRRRANSKAALSRGVRQRWWWSTPHVPIWCRSLIRGSLMRVRCCWAVVSQVRNEVVQFAPPFVIGGVRITAPEQARMFYEARKEYPDSRQTTERPICHDLWRNGRCRFMDEFGYCQFAHPAYLKDENMNKPDMVMTPSGPIDRQPISRRCPLCTMPMEETCSKCASAKPSRAIPNPKWKRKGAHANFLKYCRTKDI